MVEAIKSLVRPVVTYVFAGAVVYGFLTKLVDPKVFITLATMAFTFYFVDRLVEKRVTQTAKLTANLIAKEIKNDQAKKLGAPGDSSGSPEDNLGS